jgi:hypothetical protein
MFVKEQKDHYNRSKLWQQQLKNAIGVLLGLKEE